MNKMFELIEQNKLWLQVSDLLSVLLISAGALFFIAGTLGIVRFNSSLNRLHALTKADNLGLGLIILGLMLQADSWALVVKYFMIWGLALISASVVSHLMGQRAYEQGTELLDSNKSPPSTPLPCATKPKSKSHEPPLC